MTLELWEVKIGSPGPKSINSKWVMLFVLFLFFLFIYSHLITRKKKTWFNFGISLWTRLSFHGLKTIKIYIYIFSFLKLIWVGHLITFIINCFMVALLWTVKMLLSICLLQCMIINFNVMFLFWSLFYSKSFIHFHQREIAIVLFFQLSYMPNQISFLSLFHLSIPRWMSMIKTHNHWRLFNLLKVILINW